MDGVRAGCSGIGRQAAKQGEEEVNYGTMHDVHLTGGFVKRVLLTP
jgi:hypothetical protein